MSGPNQVLNGGELTVDWKSPPEKPPKQPPVHAKAIQGSKSDISLTFCADPPPTKAYWQFGSIRVEVK